MAGQQNHTTSRHGSHVSSPAPAPAAAPGRDTPRLLTEEEVACASDFHVSMTGGEGVLLTQSPDHPRLEAEARLLRGEPVPCRAWVFPMELKPQVAELYRELFYATAVGADDEPRFAVRFPDDEDGESTPAIGGRRLPASEILALLSQGTRVEVLAGREELVRWVDGELVRRLDIVEALDRGLQGLLPFGPDGRPHPAMPRWNPEDGTIQGVDE